MAVKIDATRRAVCVPSAAVATASSAVAMRLFLSLAIYGSMAWMVLLAAAYSLNSASFATGYC